MREMARRLSSSQYLLIGILFGACVILWTRKLATNNDQRINSLKSKVDEDVNNLIESWDQAGKLTTNAADNEKVSEEISIPRIGNSLNEETSGEDNFKASGNNAEEQTDSSLPVTQVQDIESVDNEVEEKVSDSTMVTVGSEEMKESNAIPSFPEFILPTTSAKNKTLEFLDLWNYDESCTKYQVSLLEDGTLEKRALVSFPGSGNSWLRMLMMGLTGVFVHSVYAGDDSTFQSKANTTYQIPVDCGCTLLQKTHDFSLDAALYYLPLKNRTQILDEFNGKGILILRNPFSAIRSYRNFDTGGMQGKAPDSAFEGKGWDNFVGRSIASWEVLASVWIRGLKQGGIVYYERLRHNTKEELIHLSKMLGVKYDEERLNCVLLHANDNSFKRDSSNVTISDPYTTSQRILIHKSIEEVQSVLKERGLDPLPVEYYDHFEVLPEYGIA